MIIIIVGRVESAKHKFPSSGYQINVMVSSSYPLSYKSYYDVEPLSAMQGALAIQPSVTIQSLIIICHNYYHYWVLLHYFNIVYYKNVNYNFILVEDFYHIYVLHEPLSIFSTLNTRS